MTVSLTIEAHDGDARAGQAVTASGRTFATPGFMPVVNRGVVRTLDTEDLQRCGAEIVLANTYHLMLRPGADAVATLGGLHRFTGRNGPLLTDSRGFHSSARPP